MGNKSKSTWAHPANLSKASAKFCKATVAGCMDSEDSSTYKPDPDDDMYNSDKGGSEFDDAQLLTFSNVLAQAQAAVVKAEKRVDASKEWQKSYKGNSTQSQCCFCTNHKAIAARGKQAFISSWLTTVQKVPTNHNEETRDDISPLPPVPTSVSKPLSIHN